MHPATPPQAVTFESRNISAPICLNCSTFAESRKSDLWTCVRTFTFSSSAFSLMLETKFIFKSLFTIWLLSPQWCHNHFYLKIISWQYQTYWTILILVLCLLCVTTLVCSSYSIFVLSSPFFSWWTCVRTFTFSSSAFNLMLETKFIFKSLFTIWLLSPQWFHNHFYLKIISWQYQKYWTILILVLCLLCVTTLVCSSYSIFVLSSPFFSWWPKRLWVIYTYTCSPMFSINVVVAAPDVPCICW